MKILTFYLLLSLSFTVVSTGQYKVDFDKCDQPDTLYPGNHLWLRYINNITDFFELMEKPELPSYYEYNRVLSPGSYVLEDEVVEIETGDPQEALNARYLKEEKPKENVSDLFRILRKYKSLFGLEDNVDIFINRYAIVCKNPKYPDDNFAEVLITRENEIVSQLVFLLGNPFQDPYADEDGLIILVALKEDGTSLFDLVLMKYAEDFSK